ncbi:MAG: 3-dehydroquinate synthase [Prevotellaceae bacterium]|jgi:3-dehydroquinate synthase|nr:3-dehydroquinate synthase [Prevotellaceae bacterium]
MESSQLICCQQLEHDLEELLGRIPHDRLFVLTDSHTHALCLPRLQQLKACAGAYPIVIEAGDDHKTIGALHRVWHALSSNGATRHSLLINLGGGMVTDLGGFAAATFKRGIAFVNIPTTLLAMVDAAVGGKTGINLDGLKNEVGAFAPAAAVLIDPTFLHTLDSGGFYSGYAEMLKHGLISDEAHWAELLTFDTDHIDTDRLSRLVTRSIAVKTAIVAQDPLEKGVRKALNLGHTIGHAFESLALYTGRPVLHGYAVAWGLACELYLSHTLAGFPANQLQQTVRFIRTHYGELPFDCNRYETLYELMKHDKKNSGGVINFTLLAGVGDICLNQTADKQAIFEAFDFYRECN